MIELAEDERQVFTERMVAEALKGKTPSENPTFYALVGAPGSGKSTLASTIDNAVVISSDHVIAEYAKTLGIDIREDFCDREVGRFATVVSNEIYKAAVKNKMNIVYDTSVLQNTFKMLEHVPKFGYQTKLKVMLVDEYQAAMNVVERKMDNEDAFSRHRQLREKFGYPSGNPLGVKPSVSMNVSAAVEEFVMQAVERGYPLEIYEFGKKEPSFKTGDDFDRFIESLELIPMERHLERCEKLKRRADNAGREEDFMQLMALKKEMMERK